MKRILILTMILLLLVIIIGFIQQKSNSQQNKFSVSQCLPSNLKLDDVVSINNSGEYIHGEWTNVQKITIKQKLAELKAHCENKTLVDSSEKEIRFYKLTGCWGTPPLNYLDILNTQQNKINALKKKFTVIEMTCNPSGITPM